MTWHLGRGIGAALVLVGCLTGGVAADARPADRDWVAVSYSELIDQRQLSHSSESVGHLLRRLGGRPLPTGAERPDDRMAHMLLDPLLEPYAFVLSDALDSLDKPRHLPLYEVGALWQVGEAQPAWAELLRARRYVVESDGRGWVRVCLPWSADGGEPAGPELPRVPGRQAAEAAWEQAWPILRHVLAAERRRLAAGQANLPAIDVEVHAYRHLLERSVFQLATQPHRVTIDDARGDGRRPPVDLDRLRKFLDGGLQLEGARIEPDGSLQWIGSLTESSPRLLGRPIDLADFAVAYRAVFHGGLAEPYMSLDRGYSPQRSLVSYGGRIRDTALGWISLQCDIRFKTFSLGLDIVTGEDLRAELRAALPDFRTHLERMALDERSAGVARQHTRLWFYPDRVDLTVSPEGDVLAMRRVRMSAASERLHAETLAAAAEDEAPWTRATVDAVNAGYDTLAGFFPEMRELDQVVRLLSLFTWLKRAQHDGVLVPELDALLALELPALPTPRSFPQLLAFNVLPAPGSSEPVVVIDRVPVAEAFNRLNPVSGQPLPARRRYARALAALDPREPEHQALLAEFEGQDLARLDDSAIDVLTYRAERARMLAQTSTAHYQRVLADLEPDSRAELAARQQRGSELRPFSLAIGGLDLGMGKVLDRAGGRRMDLGAAGGESGASKAPAAAGAGKAQDSWRRDPDVLPPTVIPDHGPGLRGSGSVRLETAPALPGPASVLTVYGADGPEPQSRRVVLDAAGRPTLFERVESQRLLRYRIEPRESTGLAAVSASPGSRTLDVDLPVVTPLPDGLALLRLHPGADALAEPPEIQLELWGTDLSQSRHLQAQFPRALLERLVLGRPADPTPGRPLPGLSPLPANLGRVETMMVLLGLDETQPPWAAAGRPLAGEETPAVIARALGQTVGSDPAVRAVVGVDPVISPVRWARAPQAGPGALLLLPAGGFPDGTDAAAFSQVWPAETRVAELPRAMQAKLVVLVSAEAPGVFAGRLRRLAADPALEGKLLAAWCLSGPVRPDLPASLLAEGRLAALGLAEASVLSMREAAEQISALARALDAAGAGIRVERLAGPFLWYF